jgi:glycopeptide antibiotics resistance protein
MNRRSSLKLRIAVDFLLVCAFGFVVPTVLAPISRSWSILATSWVASLLAAGFLYDGLRTLGQFDMNRRSSLKLRIAVDFLLVCAFGFVVPTVLAPISRSWSILVLFFLAAASLYDGLRALGQLRKPNAN